LTDAFLEFNTLPKSYYEAKTLLRELGLGYESIHVCCNNCVLFRKKFAKLDNCPVWGLSRWVDAERKKIPQKVLQHFPLVRRLQRMFVNKKAAEEAQWHKLKQDHSEKEMSHPADGEAWQDFDREHPDFAKHARNLRLGLARCCISQILMLRDTNPEEVDEDLFPWLVVLISELENTPHA
jgi:hypothetical protein